MKLFYFFFKSVLLMGRKWGQEILPLSTTCLNALHTLVIQPALPWSSAACVLRPMICMPPFSLFCFMTLTIFRVVVLFFMPIFVLFVCSLSSVVCTSCVCVCVCVLSLPVQCWSLSYGKQRRPFRLCAPTWLRQQVWRTFNFFSTWTLFCYSFSVFFFPKRIPLDD